MAKKPARVLGPYVNGDKFRLVVCEGGGRKSVVVATVEEGLRIKGEILGLLREGPLDPARTVGAALREYLHDKQQQGAVAATIATLGYKLSRFLPEAAALAALTPAWAEQRYKEETLRKGRFGRPIAAATHRGLLRSSKEFFRWIVERGYLRESPFAAVRPLGRPRVGKSQLRIDEARQLCALLLQLAPEDTGAVAVLLLLLLGLRSSEVLQRTARDVDDDGRVLWIAAGKTRNARRRLQVPELLQPLLRRLATAGPPTRRLICGQDGRAPGADFLWQRVRRYCDLAGVPRVCPHSLRGLHSTLALEAGATAGAVAAALGHSSFAVTARHYADPDTLHNATARRVTAALAVPEPTAATPVSGEYSCADLIAALRRLPPAERTAVIRAVSAPAPAQDARAGRGRGGAKDGETRRYGATAGRAGRSVVKEDAKRQRAAPSG